ncbi:putative protein transport protein Sec61 subunit gamma [Rhodotorula toruloides]|nr:putative protein transport protein Sec61 subunit gamma [Rhodotorula toruloides]
MRRKSSCRERNNRQGGLKLSTPPLRTDIFVPAAHDPANHLVSREGVHPTHESERRESPVHAIHPQVFGEEVAQAVLVLLTKHNHGQRELLAYERGIAVPYLVEGLDVGDVQVHSTMDAVRDLTSSGKSFVKDGQQFMNKCTKPDQKEYLQICRAVAIGFAMMGGIGYLVKLIHIPINNILVGGA